MAKEFPQNIQGLINDSRRDKIAVRRAWNLSLKFLEGRQWLSYDKRLAAYVTATSTEGSSRVTVNLLLNIYRNVLARLALAYPGVVVIPASPSYEDILKAKSSETALRYYWHKDDVPETIEQLIKWLLTTGTAALHTFYDPGMECVRTEAVGAYDIFFEHSVISPNDSRWVGLRSYVDREDLKEAYPDKAAEIENAPAPQDICRAPATGAMDATRSSLEAPICSSRSRFLPRRSPSRLFDTPRFPAVCGVRV